MQIPRLGKSKLTAAAVLVAGALLGGCETKSFIDPSEMGRYDRTPLQKPILTSLSSLDRSIDDPNDEFANAEEVQPSDLDVLASDYVIGKNDLVNISVTDVVGPGVESTKTTRVSESGNISLPLIGQIHAEGLTEPQLEQAITATYHNLQLIQNAEVSVTVAEARARTFSVYGAVNDEGQYAILQSDFRILDALVLAKDVLQGVDTIYVIRQVSEDPGNATKPVDTGTPATQPSVPGGTGSPGDTLAPRSQAPAEGGNVALLRTTGGESPASTAKPAPSQATLSTPMSPGQSETPDTSGANSTAPSSAGAGFQFIAPQPPTEQRVIRVPLDALRKGDLRYNIVVRPRDMIIAPVPVVGEYYIGGHVNRTGVYTLTARKITLKEAIIGAGMLDGLAIPQRTDIIRRVGPDREVFARVDLDAIFDGTEPDIFLKPYDSVMVGTNFLAPFIAAVRGGFRFTYGFGFLYDRDFAPQQPIGD